MNQKKIQHTIAAARNSTANHKVGASLIRGNKIVSAGWNMFDIHAEIDCTSRCRSLRLSQQPYREKDFQVF